MTILQLHIPRPADDVVQALRDIADDIEAGEVAFPVTTAVVVLGHTDSEVPCGDGDLGQTLFWRTFGVGARNDTFTIRGLLATVLNRWGHEYKPQVRPL